MEQSETWIHYGLTPVLPNLVGSMLISSSAAFSPGNHEKSADPFPAAAAVLDGVLSAVKECKSHDGRSWDGMTPEERWATVSGVNPSLHAPLSEQLTARVRDPRWNDAPELRSATRSLVKRRARLATRTRTHPDPYDAVVGPGSGAKGLDHV